MVNQRHLFLAPMLLLAACRSSADKSAQYLSDGYERSGSGLIGEFNRKTFAIDHLFKGGKNCLLLQIENGKSSKGITQWRTLDVLIFDDPERDHFLVFGIGSNLIEGKADPEILCLARSQDTEHLPVLRAWRANRSAGKIQSIPTAGITCINESLGI